jgi:hypothetical protein
MLPPAIGAEFTVAVNARRDDRMGVCAAVRRREFAFVPKRFSALHVVGGKRRVPSAEAQVKDWESWTPTHSLRRQGL